MHAALTARKDTCIRCVRGSMADSYGESIITETASERQTVSWDFWEQQLSKKIENTGKKTETMVQQGKLQLFTRQVVTLFFHSLFLEKLWNATSTTKYRIDIQFENLRLYHKPLHDYEVLSL